MRSKYFTRRNTAVAAIALAVGLVIGTAGGGFAGDNMPADKTAVGGSSLEDIDPNETKEILSQRMKVSSPADLILGVTSECSILTRLITDEDGETAATTGSVDIWITIDDHVVPVQTAGVDTDDDGDVDADDGVGDNGEVTFCNRTYQRTETDQEAEGTEETGLVDKEDDYIRTKAANAFNWVALNVGVDETEGGYDDPANGNNIIDVRVFARYDRTHQNNTCATADLVEDELTSCSEAFVGKRTLVIEPVHAAVNEQSEPTGAPVTTSTAPAGIRLP